MRAGHLRERLARGADDERQREDRHDDPGGEERLPGDAAVRRRCWERKPRKPCAKSSSPKIASTMLGTPAIVSIADSTARASHDGRAVLRQPRGERDADRRRDRDPDRGHDQRADQRVEEAARLALVAATGAGDSTNRLGRR